MGASTTYTLFQVNQSWIFRPNSCSGGIRDSPWITSSGPEAFSTYTAMFLVALFSIWECQCTQGLLCAKPPLRPTLMGVDFAFQLCFSQQMTSFLYQFFSCELPPGGPPLAMSASLGGVFLFPLRQGGCLALGWTWGGQSCALAESWWVPSSWGSWLLLSSDHGGDHLDGEVGSPAAVDSHADGFMNLLLYHPWVCEMF